MSQCSSNFETIFLSYNKCFSMLMSKCSLYANSVMSLGSNHMVLLASRFRRVDLSLEDLSGLLCGRFKMTKRSKVSQYVLSLCSYAC